MLLPIFLVLKSAANNKYLCYNDDGNTNINGFLQFTGDEEGSPYAKFEAIQDKSRRGLYHIRCCQNNKYWVRQSENSTLIVAGAPEAEEDQSKWSCTLFEPFSQSEGLLSLCHAGSYLILTSDGYPCKMGLCLGSEIQWKGSLFRATDWESLVILPKYVAFKGDNGKYLCVRWIGQYPFMQFSANDIGDPAVQLEISTRSDNSLSIKSLSEGKYLDCSSEWCCAEERSSSCIPAASWETRKVDDKGIALYNKKWKRFVERVSRDGKTDCLFALTPNSITKEARMEVDELVISRSIYDVDFHLNDSRVYSKSVLTMAKGVAINNSKVSGSVDVKLAFKETKSSTWRSTTTLKLGVKTSIEAGVPFIADGKVEISTEISTEFEVGETKEYTSDLETVYKVVVPPMSKVTMSVLATKAWCDVPYSYTERNILYDGRCNIYEKNDGVYTGINCYDFKYEAKQEPPT